MDNAIYGQQSTLSASSERLHINIEDAIAKYPDWQFPLLKRWNSKPFKAEVKSHKYEWTERDLRPVVAKVASDEVASDATSFYVDTPGVFNVDDVLQKPSGEKVIVTAVSGGTLLTVEHWTGTAETMALGNTVKRVGVASRQGALADNMVIVGTENLYNYTQIFEDVVELSGTQRNSLIHGDENSAELISRKQKELMEVLQTTLLVGARNADIGGKRYSMGGLKYFIDEHAADNAIDFGGSGTWSTSTGVTGKFEDAVQAIADKNGSKPTIYMGYKAMRQFRMADDTTIVTKRDDKKRGIGVVDTYLSQLGELDIVMLRERANVMDDLIFFVDEEAVGYKAMRNRGWFTEELPYAGDGYLWQVVGEYTAKVETPKLHSYLYNLGL
jgi:hypothetical protein